MEFKLNSFVNQLKIALLSNFDYVKVPSTVLIGGILKVLSDLGYIYGYTKANRNFIIYLKYVNNKPAIRQLFLVSTPGLKLHFN